MDQYPFEFNLLLLLEDVEELCEILESQKDQKWKEYSEDIQNQLKDQLKDFE